MRPKIEKYSLLHSGSLDTNAQVVHRGGEKSVQDLKKQLLRIKTRDAILSPLIDYAKIVDSKNLPEYWTAYNCSKELIQSDNVYLKSTHRCGSRLCSVCNNIRTAKMMDKFLPLIDDQEKWGFLVLTRRNRDLRYADSEKLRNVIKSMYSVLNRIRQRAKRKFPNVDCIISLEIEPEQYKRQKRDGKVYFGYYNPHFNIFGSQEVLLFIRDEWLKEIDCLQENQRYSPCFDIKKTLLELLKYSTKGLVNFKSGSYINVKGIDTIMSAIKNTRRIITWGRFFGKNIELIESKNIDAIELKKQYYKDLPIKDTGDFIKQYDTKNNYIKSVPEFKKSVLWFYDYKVCNYIYTDEWGEKHCLVKWKEIPKKSEFLVMVDKEPFYKWKAKNNIYELSRV